MSSTKLWPGESHRGIQLRGGASIDSAGIFLPIRLEHATKATRVKVQASRATHMKLLQAARKSASVGTIYDLCVMAPFRIEHGSVFLDDTDFEEISITPKFLIERKMYEISYTASTVIQFTKVDCLVISTFGITTAYIALDNFEIGFEFMHEETIQWLVEGEERHSKAVSFIEHIKQEAYRGGCKIGRTIAPKAESPMTGGMCDEALAVLLAITPKPVGRFL